MVAALRLVAAVMATSSMVRINTESAMRDASGNAITDCQEPHIQKFNTTYYAYGFTCRNQSKQFATTIYSSTDLKAWTRRGFVDTNSTYDGTNPQTAMALWYVVYNPTTELYIGYGAAYGQWVNVYTSTTPAGPFTYKRKFSPVYPYVAGVGAGDMLIYPDGAECYFVFNSMHPTTPPYTRYTFVYKLNPAWDDIIVSTLSNTTVSMEGLWMLKRKGTYYLLGSPLKGYGVADNFYLTAPTPLGPFTNRGLFAPQGSNTFNSQTFQGLTVSGTKGDLHVFIGHRWGALKPPFPNASDIWLPLTFSDGGGGGGSLNGGFDALQELEWQSAWDLDTEGAVHV